MAHHGLNKAILIGTVDDTPRLRRAGARTRLTMRVRTVEVYRADDGGERERRSWHDVVVWGPLGEALERKLVRGARVALEGRIANTSWDGADGRKRYRTEIHAYDVNVLDAKEEAPLTPARGERDAA